MEHSVAIGICGLPSLPPPFPLLLLHAVHHRLHLVLVHLLVLLVHLLLLVDHLLALGELEGPGLPSQAVRVQPNSLVEVAVAWRKDKNMTLAMLMVSFTNVEGPTLV